MFAKPLRLATKILVKGVYFAEQSAFAFLKI